MSSRRQMPSRRWLGPTAVLIPVKAFNEAKLRLAPALGPDERRQLARSMATRVVASAAGMPVAVVCDDREVADWARALGALVIWAPGRGLNRAVQDGVGYLRRAGADLAVVAAGDLPLATDLRWVAEFSGITLIPDRREEGTNVIALPTLSSFSFSYGPGSFSRHLAEAEATGLPVRVARVPSLAWDVDVPGDLVGLKG